MRKFWNPKLNQIKVVVLETCETTAKQIEFFILIELTIRYFIPVQNAFLVRLSPWLSSISHFSGQPRLTTRFLVRNCFKHWFGEKWEMEITSPGKIRSCEHFGKNWVPLSPHVWIDKNAHFCLKISSLFFGIETSLTKY